MHVIVLGSGVIGTTTAYYLARQGAKVTVLDRQPAAALETSYANAGQVSPGYSTPWAAPGIPLKALKWLFQRHAPLAIRADGSLFQLRWMAQMLANCSSARYAVNKERMMRLSEYSRDCLRALRAETGLHYDDRQLGTLQVFRSVHQLEAIERDVAVLREAGVPVCGVIGRMNVILNSSVVEPLPFSSVVWTARPMQLSRRVAAKPP